MTTKYEIWYRAFDGAGVMDGTADVEDPATFSQSGSEPVEFFDKFPNIETIPLGHFFMVKHTEEMTTEKLFAMHAEKARAKGMLKAWVEHERSGWANVKISGEVRRENHIKPVLEKDWETIFNFVGNYIKRAEMFGLDTPKGRQAAGKAVTTLLDFIETSMVAYGGMPEPGLNSGEIREWK